MNLVSVIEEQLAVKFTGKINILSKLNRQYLGHILISSGELIDVTYKKMTGLKAYYQLAIDEKSLEHFIFVVEPEIIDGAPQRIHYPFGIIKHRFDDILKKYQESLKMKPPFDLKILVDVNFLNHQAGLTKEEFAVLDTLTEWSLVSDIYQKCDLLDHEITLTLVSLRKKGALKIIAPMSKEI